MIFNYYFDLKVMSHLCNILLIMLIESLITVTFYIHFIIRPNFQKYVIFYKHSAKLLFYDVTIQIPIFKTSIFKGTVLEIKCMVIDFNPRPPSPKGGCCNPPPPAIFPRQLFWATEGCQRAICNLH